MIAWIVVLVVVAVLAIVLLGDAQRRAGSNRRDESQREYDAALARLGFRTLQEYRQSDLWRNTKQRYRSSTYPQQCLICGATRFDLHHRSYARLGAEELFDLMPLCRWHHDQPHELLDANPLACIKDSHDYLALLTASHANAAFSRGAGAASFDEQSHPDELFRRSKRRTDLKRQRHRGGQRWMPEEDEELLKGFDEGIPLNQLAERLHRGVRAVEVRLMKLGRRALLNQQPKA
jgi:hypothetical protein